MLTRLVRSVVRWDAARRTRAKLGRLNRRELWDIGLNEGDIAMDSLTARRRAAEAWRG